MERRYYFITLIHATTVNLFIGASHVYIPNAIAGTILCQGSKELVDSMYPHYVKAGYGIKVDSVAY